jgi:hypothetical protein
MKRSKTGCNTLSFEKNKEPKKKSSDKKMAQKMMDEAASVGEGGNGVFLDNLWQVCALGVPL